MRKTGAVLVMFFALISGMLSFTSPSLKVPVPATAMDSLLSPLTIYGKAVYEREKCGDCHALASGADKTLINLDGVGSKYSLSWHYLHLEDPKMMVPRSDMPAFSKLTAAVITKEHFGAVWAASGAVSSADQSWEALQQEADQIRTILEADKITVTKNNELLALLAFLVNREASPEKLKADSIRNAEQKRQVQAWIAQVRNPMSEMVLTAKNRNPMVVLSGKEIFLANCTPCHGPNGGGLIGPNLTDDFWLHGSTPEALLITIGNGVPERGMKSWKFDFTPRQIGLLAAYVQSLRGTNPPNAKAPQGEKTN